MTTITKALDELETATAFSSKSARDNHTKNIAALRAALQDKAGEVRGELTNDDLDKIDMDAEAEANQNPEGTQYHWRKAYLRAFARNLLADQPAPVVPDFNSIAARKLSGLQDAGWQINGYAIRRGDERGFVDASGFVGWWRGEHGTVVPDGVVHHIAAIAHSGGLAGLSESDALTAIRRLSIPHWDRAANQPNSVASAMLAASQQSLPAVTGVPDDVARLDWIRDNLFTHRWNGVVGFGCAVQWQIGPDFRHKQADLRDVSGPDGDFRAAIDAAMITASRTTSQQKGGEHG